MSSNSCSDRAQILTKVPGALWVDMEDGLVIARAPRRWCARATIVSNESDDGFVVILWQPMAGTRIHCYTTHKTMRRVPVMLKCGVLRNTDGSSHAGASQGTSKTCTCILVRSRQRMSKHRPMSQWCLNAMLDEPRLWCGQAWSVGGCWNMGDCWNIAQLKNILRRTLIERQCCELAKH